MAPTRMVQRQRPTKRPQKLSPQKRDLRGNPDFTGEAWGSVSWPNDDIDVALNLTPEIFGAQVAPFESLAVLKANTTYGDGDLAYNSGANFTAGQYVVLEDNTLAAYDTAAWTVGAHA